MIMNGEGKPDPSVKEACAVLNGYDNKLLNWIKDSGVAAIASDNLAVEATGNQPVEGSRGSNLPLHDLCLFRLGIHLGELWYMAELAKWLNINNRTRLLFTEPSLRFIVVYGTQLSH